jgi:hypothetical protein
MTSRSNLILPLLLFALAASSSTGCNNEDDEFPREAFSEAYAAVIQQSYVSAVSFSVVEFVLADDDAEDPPPVLDRVESSVMNVECASISAGDETSSTVSFEEGCSFKDRFWTGDVEVELSGDDDVSITYDVAIAATDEAGVEARPVTGTIELSPTEEGVFRTMTTVDFTAENFVVGYNGDVQFQRASFRANNGERIEGYRLNGNGSWSTSAGDNWEINLGDIVVLPDGYIARDGTATLAVDETLSFRIIFDALTGDSTGALLSTDDNELQICVDENGSEACPNSSR